MPRQLKILNHNTKGNGYAFFMSSLQKLWVLWLEQCSFMNSYMEISLRWYCFNCVLSYDIIQCASTVGCFHKLTSLKELSNLGSKILLYTWKVLDTHSSWHFWNYIQPDLQGNSRSGRQREKDWMGPFHVLNL